MLFTRSFQNSIRKYLLLIALIIVGSNSSAQQYSKSAILFDLEYLRSSLEKTHFNLFAYTTKSDFQENYLEVKRQIQSDSLSLLQVTSLFQNVVTKANNGHTRIAFPAQPYLNYAQSGGRIFPLEVAIQNGKVFIRKNWSENSELKIGDELISINGVPINEILGKIYPQISAERLYFKNAQLEAFTLPRYYWQVFGEQNEFEVQIAGKEGQTNHKLTAIKAMEDFEMKRDDILNPDWDFKYLSESAAYLRPGGFGGNEEKYRSFIDSVFVAINGRKQKNLVIDLRNNPGGDDAFSDYLVSYIADRPFKWSSKFELKSSAILKDDVRQSKDTTNMYWKSILQHDDGEIYDYDFGFQQPQPLEKRYKGEVYVLVNRQSYSQSTVTAAQIQDYGFGQIVGEETAEFPNLYASIFSYQLPKTGIRVDVSKGRIQRVSRTDNNQGVIPDIIIQDHLLDEKDEILEEIQRKIKLQ